jgi:putative oxidoreductase
MKNALVTVSRLLVGSVLLYAGFMKAVGPAAEFAAMLEAYKLFPAAVLSPLSVALPYIEMWAGLYVLTGFYTRYAALAASLLFTGFIVSITSTLVRGIDLASCGCFGAESLSPRHMLIFDAGLLALALATIRLTKYPPPLSLDRVLP